MESYFQYRNLGRRLRTQLERNKHKGQALDLKEERPTANPTTPDDEVSDSADPTFGRPTSFEDIENASPRLEMATTETHRTIGTQLGISLTGIDVRSRRTVEGKHLAKVFVVGYEGSEDPMTLTIGL
jgi:hypothetical protein